MHSNIILAIALAYVFWNGLSDAPMYLAQLVSTRSLGPRSALLMTGVLEFIGALFFSGMVLKTMSFAGLSDGINVSFLSSQELSVFVFSVLLVGLVLNIAGWYFGLPISGTHALFGAMVGACFASGAAGMALLPKVLGLVAVLFVSAILGGFLGWAVTQIFYKMDISYSRGREWIPAFNVFFGGLLVLLHGANDTPKSLGLFLLALGASDTTSSGYLLVFACAISLGMLFGENRILKTLGSKLFRIRAIQGLGSNMASFGVLASATALGFPVSSTQIIVGATLGSGAAKNVSAVRWLVAGEILISWVVTLPLGILLGYVTAKLLLS